MFELMPYATRRTIMNPFTFFDSDFWGAAGEIKTDITDTGDAFKLESDLPGFKKEDIKLSLNGETLTIKATRHSDFENQEKKASYLRCERSYGTYTRSFDVTGVEVSQISASYNDGVLRVRLPKQGPKQPDNRTIVIE